MTLGRVETLSHGDFLCDFSKRVEDLNVGDSASLFAMQLDLSSPTDAKQASCQLAIEALKKARQRGVDAKLVVDVGYINRMSRIGIRDIPNWWPSTETPPDLNRREQIKHRREVVAEIAKMGILQPMSPRRQSGNHATALRRWASVHIGQPWATIHQKGGVVMSQDSELSMAGLTTGNLTFSDEEMMNNMAMQFTGQRGQQMAEVILRLMSPKTLLRSAGGHRWRHSNDDWVGLLHDINNVGDPAQLPLIHRTAEKMIDPMRNEEIIDGKLEITKPKIIVYISQYQADGKLALMLDRAAIAGAEVFVPQQPSDDYRRRAFPYNLQQLSSQIRRLHSDVTFIERPQPSHTKCLIVTYEDNSAQVLFGSDNYLTHLQKLVRNEEMAVHLKIRPDDQESLSAYDRLRQELLKQAEITPEIYHSLAISH